jgi:DNA-binding NtrC family response regulator
VTEGASRHGGIGHGGNEDSGMKVRAVLHGDVLIVEDMMIIAMEAEDILRDAGAAACHVASSVAAALDFLDQKDLSFALLDVNLGIEVSEPVAQRLLERSIPFVVASGYGDNNSGYPALSSAPSITKPYTMGQLHTAIASAFTKGGRGG